MKEVIRRQVEAMIMSVIDNNSAQGIDYTYYYGELKGAMKIAETSGAISAYETDTVRHLLNDARMRYLIGKEVN